MRRQHHDEHEEVGWISLVDLLTVLVLIGAVIAVGYTRSQASQLEAARKATAAADAKVGELQASFERANKDAGDWKVVADSAQQRFERLMSEFGKGEQTLMDQRDKAIKDFQEARATQNTLNEQLSLAKERASQAETSLAQMQQALKERGIVIKVSPDDPTGPSPDPDGSGVNRGPIEPKPSAEAQQWAKDVLKLSGSLHRTVFVVDRSQSMSRGGRWDEARETVRTYIEYLPVSHAALVVFGSDVRTIPSELNRSQSQAWGVEELPEVTGAYRHALLAELDGLAPLGETRTRRALQRAMEFKDVDTIFLFTDGTPDSADGGGDPRESVLKLVREWKTANPSARIHTVGIGDYFNSSMRDFLLGIAKSTDGTFIGR